MSSIIVEIRAAEGGADAKLLVEDQYIIYKKMAARECLWVCVFSWPVAVDLRTG